MDIINDKSEDSLTIEQLAKLLKRAGKKAKKKAFDNNLPITVLIDGEVFYEYPDGRLEPYQEDEDVSTVDEQ